ncbi:serine/threonine protein phosphatase 1 [Halospina denitrificans]|uniref:Serine/threonine protein phosphatase 1 n=1 Tax=Halospina denitrificans TaxID=332522 RepID=A0A4R7K3G6_9GAMM|nr:metallophosphoesterase [Halospina denitrificans]TDT44129.1 serine/threonine protein phosphatase 1 [Halospina denitrificans]
MHHLAQHRHFRRNQRGRDFVVSDLHGQIDRLEQHLRKQHFKTGEDRLFALGDLIDRGDHSAELIQLLEERWFFSVMGNHELMLLDALSNPRWRPIHEHNGGAWFYRQPAPEKTYQARLLHQHLALAVTVETARGPVGIVHATAPSDWRTIQEVPLEDDQWNELVWDRHDYQQALRSPEMIPPVRHVTRVVHGHVSCEQPISASNRIWIDTLYRGGDITLMPLPALAGLSGHSRSSAG